MRTQDDELQVYSRVSLKVAKRPIEMTVVRPGGGDDY
jgi:hypothetical protein